MDRRQVATALCEMPKYLREHPDVSLSMRLGEILARRTDPVREADLVSILSVNPDLLESWAAYVEDQRTSNGWYVAVSNEAPHPAWTLAQAGKTKRVAFDSPSDAYGALILRIVAQGILGARGIKAPSGPHRG